MSKPLTYSSYLRVDELLELQTPRSTSPTGPEHDELLFIVIHQVYELWFKQLLHEIDHLAALLRAGDAAGASRTLRRTLTIMKTIVAQVDVLETMTPLEFGAFRGHLESASGFQSAQFRELEFLLGMKRAAIVRHFTDDPAAAARLQARMDAPTLWDAFLAYLAGAGWDVPTTALTRDVAAPLAPDADVQTLLIAVYRAGGEAANVAERLLDLDEGMQEWRYRHVKMVERTIGVKMGTGGSPGVGYLATTLKPCFPDLWAIRASL
jgi:tryptophan 2,3-dioxygenase